MELNLNWTKDPVVQLEDAILPVLWLPIEFVLDHDPSASLVDLSPTLDRAADILRSCGTEFLEADGAVVASDGCDTCEQAADLVAQMHDMLKSFAEQTPDREATRAFVKFVQSKVRPAVLAAINVFRETFLTMVLSRQHKHANMSVHSIAELDVISKKIFFVAINASVEAARVGDHGAGFAHISSEIRSLSQSAQAMIEKMRTE
ncbi:hypothetical protein KX928_21995 [Roseobacter sp. YSTF-M11]|uniref:Methyl-accepting transducer domain-containing protein n=1 Tax=Roseobacter insulae TaxID=2859783 RepID=A0A9X1FZK0_9RHOB|nr:methyl-accepting chemotaxis protein [Roseobacter insulae]MBW4710471.1 hypothetical protein [Roseobacter insulae]